VNDGENILLERRRRKMPAYKLAAAASVAPSVLSEIEHGHREATFDQKLALARALGIEPESIFARVTP